MERLAQMYLMKLRYKNFVTDAGAAWRQVFVILLYPWMAKHRVFNEERMQQAWRSLIQRQNEDESDRAGAICGVGLAEEIQSSGLAGVRILEAVASPGDQAVGDVLEGIVKGFQPEPKYDEFVSTRGFCDCTEEV
jgi:hypothetical protein